MEMVTITFSIPKPALIIVGMAFVGFLAGMLFTALRKTKK